MRGEAEQLREQLDREREDWDRETANWLQEKEKVIRYVYIWAFSRAFSAQF